MYPILFGCASSFLMQRHADWTMSTKLWRAASRADDPVLFWSVSTFKRDSAHSFFVLAQHSRAMYAAIWICGMSMPSLNARTLDRTARSACLNASSLRSRTEDVIGLPTADPI